ncbi:MULTISPECIES: ubiquitin family protein [Streptomyces]|nr:MULTISPECIES: hypothetical protein [Streptomyces]
MEAYCSKTGESPGSVRFLVDGGRINSTDTSASLELEDNGSIDVMESEVGG